MNTPENLKYTVEHEWISIDGNTATIGITDFAQSALGDIVFVELPEKGSLITKGKSLGVVESIKSVSDIYAPLSGEVIERNDEIISSPELCNKDAYKAWMLKIKISNTSELENLLNASAYSTHCQH
ncbi:MAG: glycine cleavage system protein GcvH [Bacteriovoracaceae bacterium]|nr:glycine cleavage system protein GcvH [Bacteriovoracaceae bacterium]